MPESLATLEFRLNDEVDGRPLTPANVDLPTLRGFLDEVEKLIKGDVAEANLKGSQVRIEEGSLKVVASVALMLAVSLEKDVETLAETQDLDQIHERRAEIIETWQARARKNPKRRYLIDVKDETPPLTITSESLVTRKSEDAWTTVEKYVTGRIVDMGGKQSPNVHLVVEGSDELLKVSATETQIAGTPHLYQNVTLRIAAEQHLTTKKMRDAHLLEFLPTSKEVDEAALARLWEKGREAWKQIPGATAWVEGLRGT